MQMVISQDFIKKINMSKELMLDVAIGTSRESKIWKNKKMSWPELVARLSTAQVTAETYLEFMAMNKDDQGRIKDVGGYVGGYLKEGRRKPENVSHRQVITLDIDFAHKDFWDDFTLTYEVAAVLHATHKHCEASPRLRLVIPLSRKVTPDEYVAVSRRLAGDLGIELFDNTTFQVHRLMYWPSVPRDVQYYFQEQKGEALDVDKTLERYVDWTDTSAWPIAGGRLTEVQNAAKKQEDPTTKGGIVGAWGRTYGITETLGMLEGVYAPTSVDDRWTYLAGSAASGLIVYDDKFAFSHHGTDPIGGRLVNSFDLYRIHKFGDLDNEVEVGTPTVRLPSFAAMEKVARSDEEVRLLIAQETQANAQYDFAEDGEVEDSMEWAKKLELDSKGKYQSSANNITLILANDSRVKEAFRRNEFDSRAYVFSTLPWRRVSQPEPLRDVDYAGIRHYLESIYGITGKQKIDDALELEFERNRYHPVKAYLKELKWDGVKRLDYMLVDYFGAEDTLYSREAGRKMMTGGVARIMQPGVKFDLVVTLVGPQGTGKSTFIKTIGKSWFSDTVMTVQGKEALEQVQGKWVIELAELSALRKAEVESIKHFISKQEDSFRVAYGRVVETFKRQCIFIGSINNKDFLRDPSGNRRFLPIDVHASRAVKDVWVDLPGEVDQLWAEAVELYKQGETLYLGKEAERQAYIEQVGHSEQDDRTGLITMYLERMLPEGWEKIDLGTRRMFLSDPDEEGEVKREVVCVAELWCECLGKNREDMTRFNTKELNDMMKAMDGWSYSTETKYFPIYGKQRYYHRVKKFL